MISHSVAEALGAPGPLDLIAPGVLGRKVIVEDVLYIPVVQAVEEGNGDVGRFLDSLEGTVRIPEVASDRLRGMLERRGYVPIREWVEEFEVYIETMERCG